VDSLLKLYRQFQPKFIWVKGHNNHPQNERCDKLAVLASKKKELQIDVQFEGKNSELL